MTAPRQRGAAPLRAAAIERARGASLVTIEAPAGYGKTALMAEWAAHEKRSVAWVSLTARDDDPAILAELIATALCDAIPQAGSLVVLAARGGRNVLSSAVPMLASAVRGAPEPFVLFLDDVQALRSVESHEVVDLIASAVPQGSTLVLASRGRTVLAPRTLSTIDTRPLGVEHLRLSDAEALELVAAAAAGADAVTAHAWVERCEGWVTGIRMLSPASADARDGDAIEGAARLAGEYLDREILDALDERTRDALVSCSILDAVTADLADAVREAADSAELLRSLAERHCFIELEPRHPVTYRLHPLLRARLRAELESRGPRHVAEAHRRAARWLAASGEPEAAMEQWLAARDLAQAAALFAEVALPLYHAGRTATLRRWVDAIGEVHIFACPPAALSAALLEMVAGDPAVAARRIRLLGTVDTAGMDASTTAHFIAAEALLKAMHARDGVEAARDQAGAALELQGRLNPWRDAALGVHGHLLARTGRTAEARAACIEAIDLAATFGHQQAIPVGGAELALLALGTGDLDEAVERAEVALRAIDEHALDERPAAVTARAVAALVRLRRGDREDAMRLLALAMPRRDLLTKAAPTMAALARLVLAEVQCAFGDFAAAEQLVAEATDALAVVPVRGDLDERLACVRALIDAGTERGHFGASAALTAAERRLLPLLPTHLTREQMARELHVSRNTVGTQMSAIFRKLGAASRTYAVQRARELGML